MRDDEVRSALSDAVAKAEAIRDERVVKFDAEPLRQLDVALWSAASK